MTAAQSNTLANGSKQLDGAEMHIIMYTAVLIVFWRASQLLVECFGKISSNLWARAIKRLITRAALAL
jgi:hypothetical protein